MWPIILFLGIGCGVNSELIHRTYTLEIDNGILNSVKPTEQIVTHYDLSNLGIHKLDKNVFDQLIDAKSLNLGNNLLKELPEFVFSNLTKLENLSLANNKLSQFENAFVGLNNLQLLDVTNNSLRHLRKSYFFGVTKDTNIITEGNELWSISAVIFENPFLRETEMTIDDELKIENENITVSDDVKAPSLRNNYEDDNGAAIERTLKLKICKTNGGLVKSVEELKKNEAIPDECVEVPINYEQRTITLQNLKIKKFENKWYKLDEFPFNSIDLSNNEISEITANLLNDLPANLAYVNLASNKIERLKRNVIENANLRVLNFKDNIIEEIEYGALEKTNLSSLFLIGNRLKSIKFVPSLPTSLHEIILSKNMIGEIPNNSFEKLKQLVYLNMAQNNITELRSKSLCGLSSLQVLILTKNNLANIELGSFNDLISLRTLYLYQNSIDSLKNGVWTGLENLKDLNLAWNKLTNITEDTFFGLPETLRDLHVDYNEIVQLAVGSFVHVPKFTLSLDGNKISNIPKGTFLLSNLQELHLKNNSLITIDGDSFNGLPRLRRLLLNANRIETIHKGAAKHLNRLHLLDISKNPIQRLNNGALFGLPKSKGSFVYVSDTPLRIIQGSVFDDV